MLEPIVYKRQGEDLAGERFGELVVEGARRLAALDPGLLKLQHPGSAAACRELDAACGPGTPWVLLGGGAEEEALHAQLEEACAAGASGFIVGRTLWGDALVHDPTEQERALQERAVPRLERISALARRLATPWRQRVGAFDDAAARPVRRQRLISADGRREPLAGDAAVIGEPFLDTVRLQHAVGDDRPARRRSCGAARPGRSAATPRPGRRARRRSATPSRRPHHEVAGGARPTARPISPSRPRQRAPPRVAISSASRACMAAGPPRRRPSSRALRVSIHSDAESADDEPSQPMPTGTPAARSSRDRGEPGAEDLVRARAVGDAGAPAPPSRAISSAFGYTQCATQERSVPQPTSSK